MSYLQRSADSWSHALLDCNLAKSVWVLLENDASIPVFGDETDDAKLWLFGLSARLDNAIFVEVLVTFWAIWWARRRVIHEGEFQSRWSTNLFIRRYIEEVEYCSKAASPARSIATTRREPARWLRPGPGMVKLNADGVVAKTTNKGAVGVVCRNDEGLFLGAWAVGLAGVTEPATLEAHACRETMALVEDLHLNKISVAFDSLRVVNELQERVYLGPYGMILRDIIDRVPHFQECPFSFKQCPCK